MKTIVLKIVSNFDFQHLVEWSSHGNNFLSLSYRLSIHLYMPATHSPSKNVAQTHPLPALGGWVTKQARAPLQHSVAKLSDSRNLNDFNTHAT